MSKSMYIVNGHLVDPASGRDEKGDLYIKEGHLSAPPKERDTTAEVMDARGCLVTPGLLDIHVHLREPGGEESETIATGSAAAARGGFTTVVSMPNTQPAIDSPERVRWSIEEGKRVGLTQVLPSACITCDRAGKELADLPALAKAGAAAFTDDGCTVQSDDLMKEAMVQAHELGIVIMDHAQDRLMELEGGVMHQGTVSERHGLPGIPSEAEIRIVNRDIELAAETGCAVHIQHVTTREAVNLIREGKKNGIRISGEASPHHLSLTDEDIDPHNAHYKMNPPLRSPRDREGLLEGVADGTLDILATDHAPHCAERKALGFLKAPFGVVGLETAVGVTYRELVEPGLLTIPQWVAYWTTHPARLLNLPTPSLEHGQPAHLALIDKEHPYLVRTEEMATRSKNSPFTGWTLPARNVCTLLGGRVVWSGLNPSR